MRSPIDAFHTFIREDDTSLVELMLNIGIDPNEIHEHNTALSVATETGNGDMVNLLLDHDADPDLLLPSRNNTVLHYAAEFGLCDIIESLLLKGAAINLKDIFGETPLMYAISGRKYNAISLLIQYGALMVGALEFACRSGDPHIVQILLERGCNIEEVNTMGLTPLMIAVASRNSAVVKVLIKNHVNIDYQITSGQTALMGAIALQQNNIIHMLLEAGANANIRDRCGDTALMMAVVQDDKFIVDMLMAHGADPEMKNMDHISPLEVDYIYRKHLFE
jgi:ankyrin repeat protein